MVKDGMRVVKCVSGKGAAPRDLKGVGAVDLKLI
jgi:hypothetical protein